MFGPRCRKRSEFSAKALDLVPGEPGGPVTLASIGMLALPECAAAWPTLCYPVPVVVGVGAKEKMLRIHAGGHVTTVTYAHSVWNRTIVEFEAKSMG